MMNIANKELKNLKLVLWVCLVIYSTLLAPNFVRYFVLRDYLKLGIVAFMWLFLAVPCFLISVGWVKRKGVD